MADEEAILDESDSAELGVLATEDLDDETLEDALDDDDVQGLDDDGLDDEDEAVVDDEANDVIDVIDVDDLVAGGVLGDPAIKVPVVGDPATEDDDADDEDDELDDDVEAGLDVILKDRLVVIDEEEDDDDTAEPEDRSEPTARVPPKRPGEFVCQSCFLVKHPGQLADASRMLCRDCV